MHKIRKSIPLTLMLKGERKQKIGGTHKDGEPTERGSLLSIKSLRILKDCNQCQRRILLNEVGIDVKGFPKSQ